MIIFPSESLYELRRSLMAQMEAGQLDKAAAFRQALAADPHDSMALRSLAGHAESAGDLVEAERLARAAIRNNPSEHAGYMLLQRILRASDEDSQLASGYAELGLKKIGYDEEALESLNFSKMLPELPPETTSGGMNYELLEMAIEHLEQKRRPEPPAVAAELEPHRLIHKLREAGFDPLHNEVTDGILARTEDCAPMLRGILKEYGESLLHEDDDPMVHRALALLGEMGDPADLAEITEFLELEDEQISGTAAWAFQRIAVRKPEAALAAIRGMIPQKDAVGRGALAQQICEIPDVAGGFEVLQSLPENLEFDSTETEEFFLVSVITSAWLMQGVNSPWATALQQKHANVFSPVTLKSLRVARADFATLARTKPADDPTSVHDICGASFEEVETVVNDTPKIGRNDPCWCGSGKKYKKCHLEGDQNI